MRLSLNKLHEASFNHMLCERKGGYLNPTRAMQLQSPPALPPHPVFISKLLQMHSENQVYLVAPRGKPDW